MFLWVMACWALTPVAVAHKLPDGLGPVTRELSGAAIWPTPASFKGAIMDHPGNNTFHGKDRNYGVLSK